MEEKYIQMITEVAERAKSNSHQIDDLKSEIKDVKEDNKALNKIATSIELMSMDLGRVKDDVSEVKESQISLKSDLDEVKQKDNQKKARWFDDIGKVIFTAVSTGIVAFLLGILCPTIFK